MVRLSVGCDGGVKHANCFWLAFVVEELEKLYGVDVVCMVGCMLFLR